jgi:hypothetical protein
MLVGLRKNARNTSYKPEFWVVNAVQVAASRCKSLRYNTPAEMKGIVSFIAIDYPARQMPENFNNPPAYPRH